MCTHVLGGKTVTEESILTYYYSRKQEEGLNSGFVFISPVKNSYLWCPAHHSTLITHFKALLQQSLQQSLLLNMALHSG